MTDLHWDPMEKDGLQETPLPQCIRRLKSDLKALHENPLTGIFVVPDDETITIVHALIIGPPSTPYEKGFFYFFIRLPYDYPIRPPMVKLMTTDGGRVRFNPNMYASGKICLSILGTWTGPSWSPAQTLSSVLLSIQSLLNDKPYHNEPGYEIERNHGDVQLHNECVLHETLRVSVCGMLRGETAIAIPPMIVFTMQQKFVEFFSYYVRVCEEKLPYNGECMKSPLDIGGHGTFQYSTILKCVGEIYIELTLNGKSAS